MSVDPTLLESLHGPIDRVAGPALQTLAELGAIEHYSTWDRVLEVGTTARRFHLVTSGRLRVSMAIHGRPAVTIQTLRPGDLAGLSWLFPPHEWLWDVVAVEDSETVSFNADQVLDHCRASDDFRVAILELVARELHDRLTHARLQLLDLFGIPA